MGKLIEVTAISSLKTTVVMTSQVEKGEDLEIAVGYAMHRIKKLDTMDEKFELETVRAINTLKEPRL